MINCPKCGEAVKEEKAFCHKCGSPMDAAKANRKPLPDFGATIIQTPKRPAPPPPQPAPPVITPPPPPVATPAPLIEIHPASPVATPAAPPPMIAAQAPMPVAQSTGRETASVSPSPHRAALPSQTDAGRLERRKSAQKIGFGFVLLLLFLMFIVFVFALWLK